MINRELILCESLLDALTFYAHGMEAVTCTYGTENFSEELFEAIKAHKVESVKLAFDADEAGEKATAKAAAKLQAFGIECHQIKFPWGSDVNAFAQDQGGEALKKSVRDAVWLEPENLTAKPSMDATSRCRAPSSLVANKAAREAELPVEVAKEENILATVTKPEQALENSRRLVGSLDRSESDVPEGRARGVALAIQKKGEYYEAAFGSRLYRIGGLEKTTVSKC